MSPVAVLSGNFSRPETRRTLPHSAVVMVSLIIFLQIPLALTACATSPASADPQTVVLVSVDGFRHDYLDIHPAPAMTELAKQGFRVQRLDPVYPPETFPGHISLITGLAPKDHGIAANHFCHRQRAGCYDLGDGKDDASWLKGMPFWNLVEAYDMKAATYFWPESDARWGGRHATYTLPYAKPAPYAGRVDQVIEWLKLPEPQRPRFITLYFSGVDTAGHRHGPRSRETAQAVAQVDHHIGSLWRRMQALGQPGLNLVVVSDHGMAEVVGSNAITVDALPDHEGFRRQIDAARVRYYLESGVASEAGAAQADAQARSQTIADFMGTLRDLSRGRWRVINRDAALAMGGDSEETVADIMLLATPPVAFSYEAVADKVIEGDHGYEASVESMGAFAIGAGPAFESDVVVEEAHQLDLYPTLARILNIAPVYDLPSDGGGLLRTLATP